MTESPLLTARNRDAVLALRFARRHASAVVCLLVPVSRFTRTRKPVCLLQSGKTRARGQQTATRNAGTPGRRIACPDRKSIQTP
jgi:hypothetical protein